jgi:HNH endonuclease
LAPSRSIQTGTAILADGGAEDGVGMFAMTSAPSPSPAVTQDPIGTILGPVWHGIWLGATSSPWTGVLFVLFVVMVMGRLYRVIRWAPIAMARRDQVRRFGGQYRVALLMRAGGRCEWHGVLSGRCQETKNLQGDHVHPYSRGGSTTVGNGQVLCSRHNKRKADRIPFNWQLRRLEAQRASYFPAGVSGMVVRRASRPNA